MYDSIKMKLIDTETIPAELLENSGFYWFKSYLHIIENQKRMSRYKEKMASFLFSLFDQLYPYFAFGVDHDVSQEMVDLFIKSANSNAERGEILKSQMFHAGYAVTMKEAGNIEHVCAKYLFNLFVGNVDFFGICAMPLDLYSLAHFYEGLFGENEAEFLAAYLTNERKSSIKSEEEYTFHDMFEYEFNAVCKMYLQRAFMRDKTLSDDNFMRIIPKADDPCAPAVLHEFVNALISRLQYNVFQVVSYEMKIHDEMAKKESQKLKNERNEYKKQLKSSQAELQSMDVQLKEKENQISALKKRINSINAEDTVSKQLKEKTRDIAYENTCLARQNFKLQTAYRDILGKYTTLKSRIAEGEQIDESSEEEVGTIKEVDLNGRYLFIIGSDIKCKQSIKEEFPNAEFASKAVNIVGAKYDMVVALTGCIDHHYYLAIKKQCKSHGIPFGHCQHSNLNMIKTIIWNVLND